MHNNDLQQWCGGRVAVALSGGVDSSVAALLLKRAGARTEAFFMSNWRGDEDDDVCNDREDLAAAAAAADVLELPLEALSFAGEYREQVFAPFVAELKKGNTPNPDIFCNSRIKFRAFAARARELGFDAAATGHYAGIMRPQGDEGGSLLRLCKGEDSAKDQSYFLHRLTQEQLSFAAFPLARKHKSEVRAEAKAAGLANWSRRDSMGICFIGKRNFPNFIRRHIPDNPGEMQTPDGKVVGEHRGLHFHTIGQRKGIGLGGAGEPWFVCGKRKADNVLQVVQGGEHPLLFNDEVCLTNAHWIAGTPPPVNWVFSARLRHGQEPASCTLAEATPATAKIIFAQKQRAPSPGQSAVIYDGNICLGGGVIV